MQGNHERTGVDGKERKFIFLNDHFDHSFLRKKRMVGMEMLNQRAVGRQSPGPTGSAWTTHQKHAIQRAGHTH